MSARQSWEAAAAGMTREQQLAALSAELNKANILLFLRPKNRAFRRYYRDVQAQIRAILAADPVPPAIAAMSDDDLARELQA